MRYIWKPSSRNRAKMHVQAQSGAGAPYNGALCGLGFYGEYRTVNAPYTLGRRICRHCEAAFYGRRKRPEWLR